jgi:hypothetical protein
VRDAVAIQGDRHAQDDKEHDNLGEKCSYANVNVPPSEFFDRCAFPFGECGLARRLFLVHFFARLPEE